VVTQVINHRPAALAYLGVERRDHNLIRRLALFELDEPEAGRPAWLGPGGDGTTSAQGEARRR
jgi:hypothetical protein